MSEITLLNQQSFVSHSGKSLSWKIDCDVLSDTDIGVIADLIRHRFTFGGVYGIPNGGLRLQDALLSFATFHDNDPLLIVDDVLTTGSSMETAKNLFSRTKGGVIGVVIFARGPCPQWVTPIFRLEEGWKK